MKELVIDAEHVDSIPVRLVGVKYSIRPPKTALAIRFASRAKAAKEDPAALMEAVEGWVHMAFGKTTGKKVLARLDASDDDLDIEHIVKLMEALVEQQAGDPTTS